MKTLGETLMTLAIHASAAKRDWPGIAFSGIRYDANGSQERAVAVYELLDALDASNRDTEVGLGANTITWNHTPETGESYGVAVYFN